MADSEKSNETPAEPANGDQQVRNVMMEKDTY